ncbi:MAG: VOC family protein [Pseudomonadales bacterium]|jgi:catechol 2,3-dioxygenase-like lactoylglutathione lyase family enzyme|nr:VOC family protein [Pseudomonadales bacterium]
MSLKDIDHVAIPIENVEEILVFYEELGFRLDRDRAPDFYSVHLGNTKINFHAPSVWHSERFTLRGRDAIPGCGDFCLVWEGTEDQLHDMLHKNKVPIVEGPIERDGAMAGGRRGISTYVRDPDGNLIEFIRY